jgi:hypothetical protein
MQTSDDDCRGMRCGTVKEVVPLRLAGGQRIHDGTVLNLPQVSCIFASNLYEHQVINRV